MPLNPELYAALKREFGSVKISNQGFAMTATYLPGLDGRLRLRPIDNGEYYTISCPYCSDTGHHLYINHRWGLRDPHNGTRNRWLATCFLNDCMRAWDNRNDLAERLDEYNAVAEAVCVPLKQGKAEPALRPVDLPTDFVPLTALPENHPALRYLCKRGFDPERLAEAWGVGYSRRGCSWWPAGRVVIPLDAYVDGHGWCLVGWQARAIEPGEKIKYYTRKNTPKSRMLYGLHAVEDEGAPVLICEGVTDVWSAGDNAVALLGKNISPAQRKLVRKSLSDRPLVVMLDPEAAAEAKEVAARIDETLDLSLQGRHPKSRVVVARLPDERDPGDCTRAEIWKAARAALSRGVKKKSR